MSKADLSAQTDVAEAAEVLRRLWSGIRARRWQFLLVFLSTFVAVQLYGFFWPGTYRASAALLIQKTRQSSRLGADLQDPTTVITAGVAEEEVNSEIAILTSREVLAATVEAAGLDRVRPPWYLRLLFWPVRVYEKWYADYHDVPAPNQIDRAIEGLGKSISVTRVKDSNTLLVTFEAHDPDVAEIVLGEVLQHYLDHHLDVHAPSEAAAFFNSQVSLLESELESREQELQALKSNAGIIEAAEERSVQLHLDAKLREEYASLTRRIVELDGAIVVYDEALAKIRSNAQNVFASAETPPVLQTPRGSGAATPLRDGVLSYLKAEALRFELEQIRLESIYHEDFPTVKENQRKLETVQFALERERANVVENSSALLDADQERVRFVAERAGVMARRDALEDQLLLSRRRLLELDQNAMDVVRAQRLIESVEARYLVYLARGERARIDVALDQGRFTNVSVAQAAAAPRKPVSPRRLTLLLVSIAGSLMVALLVCLGLEIKAAGLTRLLSTSIPRAAD